MQMYGISIYLALPTSLWRDDKPGIGIGSSRFDSGLPHCTVGFCALSLIWIHWSLLTHCHGSF